MESYHLYYTRKIELLKYKTHGENILASIDIIDYNAINDIMRGEMMACLTIRNLDDELKAKLRLQAAQHGCSMEEEVRSILRHALVPPATGDNFAACIHQRFESVYIESLDIPPRQEVRTPPDMGN